MGILYFFKKKKATKKHNMRTLGKTSSNSLNNDILNIDLEDTGRILNNYIKDNPNSKQQYNELENKLKEYEAQEKLKKNTFNEYYSKFLKAKDLEKAGEIEKALSLYMDVINNYNPEGSSYYERPAIILEKIRDYKRALSISMMGKQNLITRSINENNIDISYFDNRIARLESKIKNPPNPKSIKKADSKEVSVPPLHKPENQLSTYISSWNISISFGRSTSSNYDKAVYLAKQSSNYFEDGEGKNIIHQATFTSSANDYLNFIKLYELVGSWKSSFVFINGEISDRKIIGKLNYCYGDKCRSGNDKFCYGASEFTTNPFGCHRLQVSEHNNPWWSFGMLDTKGIWHVDKDAILNRINQYYVPYKNCPSFSYEKIMFNLNNLPNTINPKKDSNWDVIEDKIYPSSFGISINLNDI